MSIYTHCVYLTEYSGSKLPPFYIGSTSVEKVQNGYRGSVSSKEYSAIWKTELRTNPNLFKTIIISYCKDKKQSLEKEYYFQQRMNVVENSLYINKGFANKNFFFTCKHTKQTKQKQSDWSFNYSKTKNKAPAYDNTGNYIGLIDNKDPRWGNEIHGHNHFDSRISESSRKANKLRIELGIHNFQGEANPSRIRVKNGTHHWLPGSKERESIDEYQRELVRNNEHYWQSEEHKQKTSENTQNGYQKVVIHSCKR